MEEYGVITVKSLLEYVLSHKEDFPKGLDTVIMTGDFEDNFTHEKHEFQLIDNDPKYGDILILGYEMHENYDYCVDEEE